jgi:YD repeat-containing protein
MIEGFESMFKTAANIEAMEEIIRQSSGAQTSPSNVASVAGYTKADVTKLQFEKDEFGNRAIETDPDKRKEYYRVRDLVHGTQAHREQVG